MFNGRAHYFSKKEMLKTFKEFKAMVENQVGRKIKILRTDNGTDYVIKVFKNFLK